MTSTKGMMIKMAGLQILPCTVSQLFSALQFSSDSFGIDDCELNQVSVVGIIRGLAPFVTFVQYSVDDMTGPPLAVKQWVSAEDCPPSLASPGDYVKVTGSLRNIKGQRSLLACYIRCIKDLNEITSHMLEVVQAHMQLFGKSDMNMNTVTASGMGRHQSRKRDVSGCSVARLPYNLSTIQDQVLHTVRRLSAHEGICFSDLREQLNYISLDDIRKSLEFLLNEGHVFYTTDEHHFKAAEN
ncbi:replication protein A 32 kDa subunit-A-like [Thalassophryne amazonica]|uniref:replication protein A 32 kDa subunit-A-like n=1 Tax=Thalassophryne amazonica TaxID=390379 RepID=UPI00147233BE|nr:replication protein A 32 kDa subunit-A-like [Thalassophryne amazonica]